MAAQSPQDSARRNGDTVSDLRYLVRSVEPAVVFSSLAHLCVPLFSDECTVDVVEDDEVAYRISYPFTDRCRTSPVTYPTGRRRGWADSGYSIRTRFASTGYAGTITHVWRTRVPTPADVSRALILARCGVDTVREERQDGRSRHGHDTVEQLAAVETVARPLDPATAALLDARAQRLRQWARCETQHIARR